jgi:peptide-methionine (R)-S-oxide reductase
MGCGSSRGGGQAPLVQQHQQKHDDAAYHPRSHHDDDQDLLEPMMDQRHTGEESGSLSSDSSRGSSPTVEAEDEQKGVRAPAPITDTPIERPLQPQNNEAFCSINGADGCGCGGAPEPPDPMEWMEHLDPEVRSAEQAWHTRLSAEQFRVLRMKGTEEIHTGEYNEHFAPGVYNCAACALPLYKSSHKFKSGHGWPAFCDNIPDALDRHTVQRKVEITCSGCGGHVGHVFKSSRYPPPKRERHCVNSISLKFVPA